MVKSYREFHKINESELSKEQQIARLLNSKLNPTHNGFPFFDYKAILALAQNNLAFFEKPEVKLLLKTIEDNATNFNSVVNKANDDARKLYTEFQNALKQEFGTNDIYYEIPKKLGYTYKD